MPTNGTGIYDYDLALTLRLKVYDLILDWTGKPDNGYWHTNRLLGNSEWATPGERAGNIEIMKALTGPHGYTVYKMLLIKREMKPL